MSGRLTAGDVSAPTNRPRGVTALACFCVFGVLASGLSFISLLDPGGPLEPIWTLNPRAREQFGKMGLWAVLLMGTVCAACAAAAYGFIKGRRWGYWLGIIGLSIQLTGDLVNGVLGIERRALVGVPIVALLLWYLRTERVKVFFECGERSGKWK